MKTPFQSIASTVPSFRTSTHHTCSSYQCLHCCRSLYSQVLHSLEHIHHPLCLHPINNDVQCYKHSTSTNSIAEGREKKRSKPIKHTTYLVGYMFRVASGYSCVLCAFMFMHIKCYRKKVLQSSIGRNSQEGALSQATLLHTI